ncbi:acetyl-CoA carboxylase biotin carboxyl carrier protein subunit [Rhodohalobacter mucosus]|uniref:Acetyl-CoA carboxylase biotin carboxyl carrier protein subunit n=1 Tax=Rhodohalobacter mucosus TaxID=2079485 RepID=A0A316TVT2_9BACT|nr:acetyl-CoA carboxylase biotin carboxyl carrier protein subunit [Rhodohalobacter mucosus]PWN06624.1 acetyl-CoA carboxylase biotin carboxyl carrier protein subunit [Rhodohalobacter mucosus]
MQYKSTIGNQSFEVTISDDRTSAIVNGENIPFELVKNQNGRILFRTGTKLYRIDNIETDGRKVSFSLNGKFLETDVLDEKDLLLEEMGFSTQAEGSAGTLNAPMPGKILELLVREGDEVEQGDSVIILEAMKMENELKAPTHGVVVKVDVKTNDNVEKNQPLLEIEPRG